MSKKKSKKATRRAQRSAAKQNPTRMMVPTICSVDAPFVDERGTIQNILHGRFAGAQIITSKAGAVRAEHYHDDSHHCFVVSGEIEYLERPIGSSQQPLRWFVKPGELFFTPANVEHAMRFVKDTVMVVFSSKDRTPESYEKHTTRLSVRLTHLVPAAADAASTGVV